MAVAGDQVCGLTDSRAGFTMLTVVALVAAAPLLLLVALFYFPIFLSPVAGGSACTDCTGDGSIAICGGFGDGDGGRGGTAACCCWCGAGMGQGVPRL